MIELPGGVNPASFTMRLVDFGGVQSPSLGGKDLRVNRLGNRFACDVTLPPLPNATGLIVVSRLIRAKSEGLRIAIPQTNGNQGSPGTPLLNGAVTGGTSLVVDGLTAGYAGKEGYWLSIVKSGQHYVHSVAADFTANGSGQATITIAPAVRVSFPDNAAIYLLDPRIEGNVTGDELSWEYSAARNLSISFSIREAA